MKIIDRYVLGIFVKNYLISLMVLVGMYVALDMVFNFGNLTQQLPTMQPMSEWRIMRDIMDFYFYKAFFFFVQLSGMIAVVAAAFTIMRLSRFNEMTALLAAGTPLVRVAMPVILAGVVLNVILLPMDQEIMIPDMIPKLMRDHGDVHRSTLKMFPVNMTEDPDGGLFNAARVFPAHARQSRPHRISRRDRARCESASDVAPLRRRGVLGRALKTLGFDERIFGSDRGATGAGDARAGDADRGRMQAR